MRVQRMTFRVKVGRMDEFIKLQKDVSERIGRTVRIYTVLYGARDTAVVELEFETIEDQKKFWDDWFAQPEAAEFMKKLNELVESGGTHEALILH